MKLVGLAVLDEFRQKHADSEQAVLAWVAEAKESKWQTPGDIKKRYASASFMSDNRVVFNIKGNRYRLYVKVYYRQLTVIIKRVGTHTEYDGWEF